MQTSGLPVKNTFVHFDDEEQQPLVRSLTCPLNICSSFPNENSSACSPTGEVAEDIKMLCVRESAADGSQQPLSGLPLQVCGLKEDVPVLSPRFHLAGSVSSENSSGASITSSSKTRRWGDMTPTPTNEEDARMAGPAAFNMPVHEEKEEAEREDDAKRFKPRTTPEKLKRPNGRTTQQQSPPLGSSRTTKQAPERAAAVASSAESRGVVAKKMGVAESKASRIREEWKTKFLCRFPVQIEAELEGGFRVCRRIFGPGGVHMKEIARETNAKLRLRGRSSGFKEGEAQQEADIPLELNLSADDREGYSKAIRMVETLLEKIYGQYRSHCRKHGLSEERFPHNLQVWLDEHPSNPK